jgi:hypothetical protein
LAASKDITDHVRKRLWARSDDRCAFPGCEAGLLEPTRDGREETVVGEECHIVAKRDHPSVARAPSQLTDDERVRFKALIEHRHSYENLVLMCERHSTVIDDRHQGYSVAAVVEMKKAHEQAVTRDRQARRAHRAAPDDGHREVSSSSSLLILDDIAAWERKAVRRLVENEPETWSWLCDQVGEPADANRVVELVGGWPDRLANGSVDALVAVARLAEGRAAWSAASTVWERAASRVEGTARADHLVRAAVDAGQARDAAARERLLTAAEQADPDSPRLHLERLDASLSPADELELLDELHSDDASLASLIAACRARAAMLLPDLDQAARHLAEARKLDGGSMQVRAMDINLRVQRARVAIRDDQDFVLTEVERAKDDALKLRGELIAMGRWEESGSLLMLAADVPLALRDPEGAAEVLAKARLEEIEAPDGAHVLGDAALRAGATELAMKFIANAQPSDAVRRIRATVQANRAGPARTPALDELHELAVGGGPESDLAAAARLGACLPPVSAPWDEQAAAVLAGGYHARVAEGLRIMALAQRDAHAAEALADELPEETWAEEIRLRVAGIRGNYERMRKAATRYLTFGPDAAGQLLAGIAFAKAGDLDRAGVVLTRIAHDVNAAPAIRSDAFNTLLKTLADRDDWQAASREWRHWQEISLRSLRVPDERVSAWQVRVAHHDRRRK